LFELIRTSVSLLTKKQRLGFGIIVATRTFTSFLDIIAVAAIGVLGAFGASGFLGGEPLDFFGFPVPQFDEGTILLFLIVISGFFLLKTVVSTVLLRWMFHFLARIETSAASTIAQFLFSGGLSNLRRYSRAEIQWGVTSSTSVTFSGVLGSLSILLTESLFVFSMFLFFSFVDVVATVAVIVYFVAVIGAFQLAIHRKLKKAGRAVSEGNVSVTQSTLDMVDAFREMSVLNKQPFFLERFREARSLLAGGEATSRFLSAVPRFFVETALILGVIAFIGWQFGRGEVAEGLVAAGIFLTGGVRVMGALLPLQAAIAALRTIGPQASVAQTILVEARRFSQSASEPTLADSGTSPHAEEGLAISLQNVTFTHPGNSEPTVGGVNLEAPPGSYIALVGPSGAGKTTLADLILGLYSADSGQVLVGGVPASQVRLAQPGLMSYVPQRPGLVSGSIAQNVALGVPVGSIDYALVGEVLHKSQLADFVDTLPEGVNAELGKHSEALSGGQVQRLGLARALYTQPRLIVLDEATSALDAGMEASVSQQIHDLGKDTTVVVIAHRLSTIQKADTVYLVDGGRIVASGTFKQLRKTVPMIQEYVSLMSFDED
jgi:ATP-binding cassette subfamily C protein